ncbi:MAG: pyridoxal-phosphate dependent enzyme [Cyclobacteriaceae bacterium]
MERIPSPLEKISDPLFEEKDIEVWIKRDDLIHPRIMGNKWRKLKYNILHIQTQDLAGIVTLGGAYSNHIAATAAACADNNIPCVGIIRGEELKLDSNDTLLTAHEHGMALRFVTRARYRDLTSNPSILASEFPDFHIVPEGGTNELAIKGCEEIIQELDMSFDHIITSVGTGGTMAGIIKALKGKSNIIGVLALKGEGFQKSFRDLLDQYHIGFLNYTLMHDCHLGGYAKVPDFLIDFINETKTAQNILFDPIYTAKMYYAVYRLIRENYFSKGTRILLVHTGGLQGIRGINQKSAKKILL